MGHTTTVQSWSYSTMLNFQNCKRSVKLEKIDKEPQPPLVIPEGKTEHPMLRGSRVHDAAERFVLGEPVELITELAKFAEELYQLKTLYPTGKVKVEEDWAFTNDWTPTEWLAKDAWCRMKADAVVFHEDEALVIDYKTGKKWGNEIKHMMQAQLYQLGAFMRYPHLETVYAEWWYTDVNEISSYTFQKPKGLLQLPFYQARGDAITSEEIFAPNPNNLSCKWCPYRSELKGGTGVCPDTVV